MTDLEPLEPARGVEMYLDGKEGELADATLDCQAYRLEAFLDWCDEEGIENLNDLTGRDLYAYRIWRKEGHGEGRDEIALVTLRGQLASLRAFLRFAAEIDAVPEGLREKLPLPSVSGGEDVSETTLDPERAESILDYLSRYEYASRRHVMLLLLWHTGARAGAIRGLNLCDVEVDTDEPGLDIVHRPAEDCPLKNDEGGERWIAITQSVARVLRDYIEERRNASVDDYGREPLLTTSVGRASVSTLRDNLYCVTRPCWRGEGCPHDRDPEECEATAYKRASTCPSSRSPHDVRSGRVTAYAREEVPRRVVSDRLNASEEILDKHYDRRSKRERANQRRDYLPNE